LQALANTTAVAMENVQLYSELEERVRQRTMQLEEANRELEAFSYSVSHDLRAPLRHIVGYAQILKDESFASLTADSRDCIERICAGARDMGELIDDLLRLAKFSRVELKWTAVDLSGIASETCLKLQSDQPQRAVDFRIEQKLGAQGDPGLVKVAIEN